jgi:hypothetical protein
VTGRRWAVLVAAGLLLAAAPLGAHHSLIDMAARAVSNSSF